MKKDSTQQWAEVNELEGRAKGMFVGGMLLDADPAALSKQPLAIAAPNLEETDAFLKSLGLQKLSPVKPDSIPDMKRRIVEIFQENAEIAMIAARNFESLPDETVKSIYEELVELHERKQQKE